VQDLRALCGLCHKLNDWDDLAHFATEAAALAQQMENRKVELAEALAWQAVAARRQGDEERARRFYRRATTRMGRLRKPAYEEYFDALSLFHELAGGTARALGVRERELTALQGRGRIAHESKVQLERCRLLGQLGRLAQPDIDAATATARNLRKPATILKEIAQVATQFGLSVPPDRATLQ
jgi:hypothetical protein